MRLLFQRTRTPPVPIPFGHGRGQQYRAEQRASAGLNNNRSTSAPLVDGTHIQAALDAAVRSGEAFYLIVQPGMAARVALLDRDGWGHGVRVALHRREEPDGPYHLRIPTVLERDGAADPAYDPQPQAAHQMEPPYGYAWRDRHSENDRPFDGAADAEDF